jgi:hypothetical protein
MIATYRSCKTFFTTTDYEEPEIDNEFEYDAGNSNKDVNYPQESFPTLRHSVLEDLAGPYEI